MTEQEYKDEIARLHEFTRDLAQRLFLAAEVLSILAERKKPKQSPRLVRCGQYTVNLDSGR